VQEGVATDGADFARTEEATQGNIRKKAIEKVGVEVGFPV